MADAAARAGAEGVDGAVRRRADGVVASGSGGGDGDVGKPADEGWLAAADLVAVAALPVGAASPREELPAAGDGEGVLVARGDGADRHAEHRTDRRRRGEAGLRLLQRAVAEQPAPVGALDALDAGRVEAAGLVNKEGVPRACGDG